MVRTNQGGSILGFLIVGGVLALLLVGGAYFVRHQLASTSDIDTESVVTQNSAGDSSDTTDKNEQESKDEDKKVEPDKKDDAQTDEVATLPGSNDNSGSENNQDTPVATDLPQTGPADTLLSSVLISGIAGVAVAYKRSRNTIASL